MACISTNGSDLLAISLKNKLVIFRNDETILSYTHTPPVKPTDKEKKEDSEEKKESKTAQPTPATSFDCHQFSSKRKSECQCYFGAVTEDKKLLVWNVEATKCTLLMTLEFPKRPTSLKFLKNEDSVLVSDKYGDIYKASLTSEEQTPKLILGHLSMVLDIEIIEEDKFIISADRDEKIRISHHPNAYNIHNYCLGHKNLVSFIENIGNNRLLSISADKTIKLWNYYDGKELSSLDMKECTEKEFVPTKFVTCDNSVLVIGEQLRGVVHLEINEDNLKYIRLIELDIQPVDICCTDCGKVYMLCASPDQPLKVFTKSNNVSF
eukprot:TCONS_00005898-protein